MLLDSGKMSISRDVIFDEDIRQKHTPVTSESVPIPDSDELPAAVKEEAALAPKVEAEEVAEEEAQETAAAATELEDRCPQRENRQAPLRFRESAYLAQSGPTKDPETYEESMQSPDADQWSLAMNEETASLQANGTRALVEEPQGVKPIPVRWIFGKKLDAQSNIERY